MALSRQQAISQYGTEAYTGWGEAEAAADARAKGLSAGGLSVPSASMDFVGLAEQAYGDLGAYYDKILKQTEGDINKAVARLTEDYDRGIRIKKEDYEVQKAQLQQQQLADERTYGQARQTLQNTALGRGIASKSAYDTGTGQTGYGLLDLLRGNQEADITQQQQARQAQFKALDTDLSRYQESADITKSRATEDYASELERYKAEQEQNRRVQAGQLANQKAANLYRSFASQLI
jgi:hypothetical protein